MIIQKSKQIQLIGGSMEMSNWPKWPLCHFRPLFSKTYVRTFYQIEFLCICFLPEKIVSPLEII